MRKLIAYAFAMILIFGTPNVGNTNEETGLGVVEQETVVVQQSIPSVEEPVLSYRERLEQMASRGEVRTLTVRATAYTHTGNRTATGIYPYVGVIAVDPNYIPLGTKVYVEGYGVAIAADTGGLIKGNKIDLFMDSESECDEWGIQTRKLYILNGRE